MGKGIKRILITLVLLSMMLLLAACKGSKQDAGEVQNETQVENTNTENANTENSDTEDSDAENSNTNELETNTIEDETTDETEGKGQTEAQQPVTQETTLDESKAVVMKTTANVNFRKEPNTSCEIIKTLAKGTEVKQYQVENGWALVKCGEDVGYLSTEYLADPSKVQEEQEKPSQNPSSSNTNKVEAIPGQHRDPNSAVVVIDPGHQLKGDSTKEPNGPGSSVMKARVTSGTTGVATGVAEYIRNLEISLKLKTELENRGYTVYMTRSTHDVNISNMERAQYASTVGADIAVRIHCNGAASSVRGAETLTPSSSNPYVSHLASASYSLSKCIIDKYCTATGFINRGVKANDTMTGINWSEVPVTIIELEFMSNPDEDRAMQDDNMQNNMVQGIANGIDAYFGF